MLFLLVFALCSVGLSLGLRQIMPRPFMMVLTPKLDAYTADAARFDTVFLGSSRTLYHVVPAAVEASYKGAGCGDISVFNLGVFGLNGSEQDWMLEQVLQAGKGHISRLIIESPLPEAVDVPHAINTRGRWFHGPSHWGAILSSINSFAESRPKRIYRTGLFVIGAAYDLSGLGYASQLFFKPPEPPVEQGFDMSEDGYEALDEVQSDIIQKRRDKFRAAPQAFDAALKREGTGAPNIEARVTYLIERLDRITQAGVKTGLYVSPDVDQIYRTAAVGEQLAAQAPQYDVFNLNRSTVHPEFYDFALWDDMNHMGRKGATMMSRQLGTEMCLADRQNGQEMANVVH